MIVLSFWIVLSHLVPLFTLPYEIEIWPWINGEVILFPMLGL